MRGTTGEIQAAEIGGTIARLERAEEFAVAREPVDRAVEHVVTVVNILRRERAFEDDALFDVRHLPGALELLDDHVAVGGQHLLPVVMRAQVRGMNQHVEGFSAGRRGGLLAARGRRQIAGRIRRRLALLVNPVELLVRVPAEDEVMMREMVVAFLQPEIEHDARAGGFVAAAFLELPTDVAVEQLAVGPDGIAVRDHRTQRNLRAVIRAHASHFASLGENLRDVGVRVNLDPEFTRQLLQREWNGPGAAHRIPDSLVRLHVRDAAKHGRRAVG